MNGPAPRLNRPSRAATPSRSPRRRRSMMSSSVRGPDREPSVDLPSAGAAAVEANATTKLNGVTRVRTAGHRDAVDYRLPDHRPRLAAADRLKGGRASPAPEPRPTIDGSECGTSRSTLRLQGRRPGSGRNGPAHRRRHAVHRVRRRQLQGDHEHQHVLRCDARLRYSGGSPRLYSRSGRSWSLTSRQRSTSRSSDWPTAA